MYLSELERWNFLYYCSKSFFLFFRDANSSRLNRLQLCIERIDFEFFCQVGCIGFFECRLRHGTIVTSSDIIGTCDNLFRYLKCEDSIYKAFIVESINIEFKISHFFQHFLEIPYFCAFCSIKDITTQNTLATIIERSCRGIDGI